MAGGFDFSKINLAGLQSMIFPLVRMTSGVDVQEYMQEAGEYFGRTATAFETLAATFRKIESALADGIITNEEVEDLIATAGTIDDVFKAIVAKEESATTPDTGDAPA